MEILTAIYIFNNDSTWDCYIKQRPYISVHKEKTLEIARESMCWLLTNEMWYLHKNLSTWMIGKEIIKYLP